MASLGAAAGGAGENTATKPVLSSKILGLAFMKRAQEKKLVAEAAKKTVTADAEAHWVVEGSASRCVVVNEGDPPPTATWGSTSGRMSFGGYNPATERLAAGSSGQALPAAAPAAASTGGGGEDVEGPSVSDAEMARHLAKPHGKHGSGGGGQQQRSQQQHLQQRPLQLQQKHDSGGGQHRAGKQHKKKRGEEGRTDHRGGGRGAKRQRYF